MNAYNSRQFIDKFSEEYGSDDPNDIFQAMIAEGKEIYIVGGMYIVRRERS